MIQIVFNHEYYKTQLKGCQLKESPFELRHQFLRTKSYLSLKQIFGVVQSKIHRFLGKKMKIRNEAEIIL